MSYRPPADPTAKPPYFHVGIAERYRWKDFERVNRIGKLNLSYEEVERQFVTPYQHREDILISGVTIGFGAIRQIIVSQSDEPAREIRERLEKQARERASRTGSKVSEVKPWDVVAAATRITDEVLGRVAPRTRQRDATAISDPDPRSVFVVHGRDRVNRDAMFALLRSINLNPIEWSEARRATGRPMPYIGDILDKAFSMARAVVVLLTPDDEARLRESLQLESDPIHETDLTGQARPNVLFEAGMAIGRHPDRTILVEHGKLRPFTDIAGLHVVRFDGESTTRQELAQRLEDAGCAVDLDGTDWHTAGDFQGR